MVREKSEIVRDKTYLLNPQEWVAKYADYLYGFTITRINDEDLARDLVQETFLAALERVEKFEGRSSEGTWLTAILKNKITDVYRKNSARLSGKSTSLDSKSQQSDFFEPEDGHWKVRYQPLEFGIEVYDPLVNKELNRIIQNCMQKLPALWRAVFTMKHIDDMDTAIICSDLTLTASNFWVIIHRTKVSLRACLQKNWF